MPIYTCPKCEGRGITWMAALYGGSLCVGCDGEGTVAVAPIVSAAVYPRTEGGFAIVGTNSDGLFVLLEHGFESRDEATRALRRVAGDTARLEFRVTA
jgi:hypothetical protein